MLKKPNSKREIIPLDEVPRSRTLEPASKRQRTSRSTSKTPVPDSNRSEESGVREIGGVKVSKAGATKALRLDKCKEEAERHIQPWYLLDGVTGLQVARPYNPVDGTEMIDQQENTNYAVSCAIWNLLDTQGEEGTPLLLIADC